MRKLLLALLLVMTPAAAVAGSHGKVVTHEKCAFLDFDCTYRNELRPHHRRLRFHHRAHKVHRAVHAAPGQHLPQTEPVPPRGMSHLQFDQLWTSFQGWYFFQFWEPYQGRAQQHGN
jgi:hypothetical protein